MEIISQLSRFNRRLFHIVVQYKQVKSYEQCNNTSNQVDQPESKLDASRNHQ